MPVDGSGSPCDWTTVDRAVPTDTERVDLETVNGWMDDRRIPDSACCTRGILRQPSDGAERGVSVGGGGRGDLQHLLRHLPSAHRPGCTRCVSATGRPCANRPGASWRARLPCASG